MRAGWIAPLAAVLAGLIVLGATTAGWVVDQVSRDVGGLNVPEVATTTGAEVQPGLVVVGLVLLLSSVPLAVARGVLRRVCGGAVGMTGLVGVGLAVTGILHAAQMSGVLQGSVWFVVAGTALGVAAGVVAMWRPARRASLPDRFDIDAPPEPQDRELDEWDLAVDERDTKET